jgi:hypothetical protein
MGKTIEELFKSKLLSSGQTAQQQYAIRNSKDAPITPYIGALNLPFRTASKIRKSLSVRGSESFFEQETTGLRIIRTLSSPIVYGTDLVRLTRQSTDAVNDMKNATGAAADAGLLGNLINRAKGKLLNLGSKLGVVPPQVLIPTRVSLNTKFQQGKEPDTMTTLAEIKEDARGTLAGKFLAQNAKGTPKQIGNQVLGGVINLAKQAVRKKLFGGRTQGQQNYAKKSPLQMQYDSSTTYSSTVDSTNEEIISRNDLSSQYVEYKEVYPELFAESANIYNGRNQLGKTRNVVDGSFGVRPNGGLNVPKPDPIDLAKSRKQGQVEVGLKIRNAKDNPIVKYDPSTPATAYSNTVDETSDDPLLRNDLSTKLIKLTGTTAENENKSSTSSTSPSINKTNNFKKSVSGIRDAFPKSSKDLFGKLATSANIPKNGIPKSVPTLKKPNPVDLINARKLGQVKVAQKEQANAPKADVDPILKNDPNIPSTAYSNTVDETSTDVKTRNDLSSVLAATQQAGGVSRPDPKNLIGIRNRGIPINQQIQKYTNLVGTDGKLQAALNETQSSQLAGQKAAEQLNKIGVGNSGIPTKKSKIFGNPDPNANKSSESKLGIKTNQGDLVNKTKPNEIKDAKNSDIANSDFMYVRFEHFGGGGSVGFRGTITGFQETFSPGWDTNKFIGSPFNLYTYSGIERSVSFNIRAYSTNPEEHDSMWVRLEALAKMVYPIISGGSGAVTPPLLFLSMGSAEKGGTLYSRKECFIENLSYAVDDTFPWEIGEFSPGYQAPQIVDINLTVKFIQGTNNINSLYSFSAGKNKYTREREEKANKKKQKEELAQKKKQANSTTTKQRDDKAGKTVKAGLAKAKTLLGK